MSVMEKEPTRTRRVFTDEFKRDAVSMVLDEHNKIVDVGGGFVWLVSVVFGDELEGVGVVGSHDGEVSVVECRDPGLVVVFGCSDEAGIGKTEAEVGVGVDGVDTAFGRERRWDRSH